MRNLQSNFPFGTDFGRLSSFSGTGLSTRFLAAIESAR
jgi:hypothetical protein